MFGTNNTTDNSLLLLQDLGLNESHLSEPFRLLARTDSRYLKDLKINISNALGAETLQRKEALLIAFAVAVNEKVEELQLSFQQMAEEAGATEKELAEIVSCTSLLNANNVYYRFRHFMNEEFYNNAPAGMRMSIMANPVLGKEFFELVSLAVSALNGCSLCVTSHEKALLSHGTSKQRIHDAVRLAAVIKSLAVLL